MQAVRLEAGIARIVQLRRKPKGGERLSFQAIADRLNAEGRASRTGRPWAADTVRGILQRAHKNQTSPNEGGRPRTLSVCEGAPCGVKRSSMSEDPALYGDHARDYLARARLTSRFARTGRSAGCAAFQTEAAMLEAHGAEGGFCARAMARATLCIDNPR